MKLFHAGLALVLASMLSGCGGGTVQSVAPVAAGSGRAAINIVWPARSRLIPDASNSIDIVVKQKSVDIAHSLVSRPASGGTSAVSFDVLPKGLLTVVATAYPNSNGSGVAQASGTVPLLIQPNQTTKFSVTMGSTIDHVELSSGGQSSVAVGRTLQLNMTAKDVAGNLVLVSPAKVQWHSTVPTAATVDGSGLVTGVAVGSSDISATDNESGKSAKVTIPITAAAGLSFQTAIVYPVPNATYIVVKDIDGDGNLDVVVGGATELGVLYGNGDGTLGAYRTIFTWGAEIEPCDAADMNGDGRLDIVCTAAPDKILVFNNSGGRTFANPQALALGNPPEHAVVADFNGDGRPDVAVPTDNPGSTDTDIRILTNSGNGLSQTATYRNIWIVQSLTAADLNGDGKLDLIVPTTTDIVGTSGVGIMWGDGTGKFASGLYFNTTTENVTFAIIADMDGNGTPDIIVDDYFGNSISVIYNNGGGSFQQASTYAANGYPLGTGVADFDGDGARDIVSANAGSGNVTILKNVGGLFPNPRTFDTGGTNSRMLAVADLNKDGRPDIVVSSESSKTISVLLNSSQ